MPYKSKRTRRSYDNDYYHAHRKPEAAALAEDKNILLTIRIKSSVVARVQRVVDEGIANRTGPYRNKSQALQDLIVRGLFTLKGEVAEEIQQYLRVTEGVDTIGRHRREAQASYSRFKVELRELEGIGAHDAAVHYYHATRKEAERMDPGTWRDWWLKTAKADFPKLHDAKVKGLSLDVDDVDQPATGTSGKPLTRPRVVKLISAGRK